MKKWPEGYHRSVFEGKDFSLKKIFSGAVFRGDSEYNIHFAVKVSEKGHIHWLQLLGSGL